MDDLQLALRWQPVSPGSAMPNHQSKSPQPTGDEDLNAFDCLGCTSEIISEIMSRTNKPDRSIGQVVPKTPAIYLKWRLAILEIKLQMIAMRKKVATEVSEVDEHDTGTYKSNLMALKKDKKTFLSEKTFILAQRKTLAEDLSDIITSIEQLEPAYIKEHRMALTTASSSTHKWSRRKVRRQKRWPFAITVHEYLSTRYYLENSRIVAKRCNITGFESSGSVIKCVRIVPHSWSDKDMAHIFGSEEPPLTSRRNSLCMAEKLEHAFDNGWIAIVPDGSIEASPTEWKVILLNPAIKTKVCYYDYYKTTDRQSWTFEDIDGRRLTFFNDNRPARRFLYMRYVLTWMEAQNKSWPGFKEKLPSGAVWASPNKSDGYLRKCIWPYLSALASETGTDGIGGNELPEDLIAAGTFEDPETSNALFDEVAAFRITQDIQDYLDGARNPKICQYSSCSSRNDCSYCSDVESDD